MTTYITAKDPELGRIMKARSRLGSKAPGYAALVFGLELVEHEGIDTMATDGKSIFWSRVSIHNCGMSPVTTRSISSSRMLVSFFPQVPSMMISIAA